MSTSKGKYATKLTRKNRVKIARQQLEFPDRGPVYRASCCGELIQSLWQHDYNSCSCGGASIDGGGAYVKISWGLTVKPPEIVKCLN